VKTMLMLVVAAGSMMMAGGAMADAAEDLAKAKGCLGCHAVDQKKVGPSFKDIAAKNKGNEAKLIEKLKEGKGHMKVSATDAELKTLVDWTLSRK